MGHKNKLELTSERFLVYQDYLYKIIVNKITYFKVIPSFQNEKPVNKTARLPRDFLTWKHY